MKKTFLSLIAFFLLGISSFAQNYDFNDWSNILNYTHSDVIKTFGIPNEISDNYIFIYDDITITLREPNAIFELSEYSYAINERELVVESVLIRYPFKYKNLPNKLKSELSFTDLCSLLGKPSKISSNTVTYESEINNDALKNKINNVRYYKAFDQLTVKYYENSDEISDIYIHRQRYAVID